jgi:hypothetical protein
MKRPALFSCYLQNAALTLPTFSSRAEEDESGAEDRLHRRGREAAEPQFLSR